MHLTQYYTPYLSAVTMYNMKITRIISLALSLRSSLLHDNFLTKTRTVCCFQLDRYMNLTHKIASKHLDTYARTLTQNPNTESFPLSIKTQTATCFPSVKDQIELFFTRCAGMHCACTGSNLSLFLASVGSSYITPCCHSTFEYTFGPAISTLCDIVRMQTSHLFVSWAYLFLN